MSQETIKKKRKLKDFGDGNPKTRMMLMVISIIGGFLIWYLMTLVPSINTFLASPKQVWIFSADGVSRRPGRSSEDARIGAKYRGPLGACRKRKILPSALLKV